MKPETSRKRLHSALKEPPIAQGGKRKRHDLKSTQQAMIHQTGVFSFEKRSFQSHSRNKPRSSKQAEPPESLSSFTDPEPRSAQGSEVYIGNSVKQGFAPDGSSSPATDYSPSNRLSVNKRRCLKQTPLLCRAHRNAIIQSSEDSFDEKGRFIVTSEHSLSNSSTFLLYLQYIQPNIKFSKKNRNIIGFPNPFVALRLTQPSFLTILTKYSGS